MGSGYHLYPHPCGLDVSGGRARTVLPQSHWLGHVVQANFQQPFDNRYLFERLKRSSVSAFLSRMKKQQSCAEPTEESAGAVA